ncbi:Protein SCP160 AltName: Full=Protein HX [Serendipita indica DSM 11827]|nr:Protein SCP160 AltName: Full=Protein HX [Serendipita indica DSM 11827]
MVLSAADLQKQLEGAPDPFPSLSEPQPRASGSASTNVPLNTDSETLFPSLATPTAPKASPTSWTPRAVKPISTPVFSDTFSLTGIDLTAQHSRDGKPRTLADVIKEAQTKFKVKVDVFSQRTSNQTSFTITGPSDAAVEGARKSLTSSLSPVISVVVQTPASIIGSIVGAKGANLKRIRDQTMTRIDIPRRDTLGVSTPNGQDETSRSVSPAPAGSVDENEPTIPITISGPASMVHEAQAMIQDIISERTSRSTQKVKIVPEHVYPFVLSRRPDFLRVANGAEITLARDDATKEIIVSGDREAVANVVESIRSCANFYEGDVNQVKIALAKRQHRLLDAKAQDQIFQKSKCSVVVPSPSDPSEDVIVWGKAANLGGGLQAVMERANSQHTHSLPIRQHPSHVLTHIHRSGYGKTFGSTHSAVDVHFPSPFSGISTVDFAGERAAVDAAQKELVAYLKLLEGATRAIEVDYLIHKILQAKAAKQLRDYHSSRNVFVYFPSEADQASNVMLVYDPLAAQAAKEKQAALAEIEAELLALVSTLGQIKTETISVEKKWHEAVKGKNNSNLNSLIGEGRALAIEVGGNGQEDIVVIRGSAADVDKATMEILRLVEEAKNDAIDSSYVTEFQIPQQYVARIVGAAGAGIQKYREQLDVKIDIEDLRDSAEQVVGKKKKTTTSSQSLVKITGRKHNAEEAKKRILAQVDKMADETTEILKVPRQYHSAIIGQQGKYIQRLQDKYGVKINMSKDSSTSPDEIQIRGGKKGVSQAKNEINELVEYEKENNHSISIDVSSRAVPRILGAKGAKIHEIMEETGAHVDVNDKDKREKEETTSITIRGNKKSVAAAKAQVLAIANAVDDETTVVLHIEPKFHRTIIGGGGVGLRNLLARVGAPSDPKEQAGLVRFPQSGDEVTLRGEKTLVKKIQAELERVVAGLRERVVIGVSIPAQQHRMLIGHGGQPLMELEKRTGAEVQFPGSRSYNQVAAAENASELEDADPKDIVKVVGPRAACEKAIAEMLESIAKAPNRERKKEDGNRERNGTGATATVSVPFKHYHLLRPTGNLVRDLRATGVNFSQDGKPKQEDFDVDARIDDEVEVDSHGVEWKLVEYGSGVQDGATEITLKARDAESLASAQKVVDDALKKANNITHVGLMTFPDRGAFPRIIGSKGNTVNQLCLENDAEIIVPRDDSTVKIYGAEDNVNKARAAITRVAFGGRGRRADD